MEKLDISVNLISCYHHQANSKVDRENQEIRVLPVYFLHQ